MVLRIKKTLKADEQDREDVIKQREEWACLQKHIDMSRFVCIDESCAKTNMIRLYGRSQKDNRCYDSTPHGSWKAVTMLSAIKSDGTTETIVYEGATDKAMFESYIEHFLLPILKENDIVVLDNLSSHKGANVKRLIESKKAQVMYLPPYSPDLNPIEKMWSKVKSILKNITTKNIAELHKAISFALKKITPKDARNCFESCGYYS